MRVISKDKDEPISSAYNKFNDETDEGNDMTKYSSLLNESIDSIINIKEDNDLESLFRPGGTTMLKNDITGLEDFELIAFMVVI